jgi:hypothetical protein
VKCYHSPAAVSITLKTKIRYNGQEYSSPSQLPPEIRAAYENALRESGSKLALDDLIGAIENNGEVTIPNGKGEPLLTKREITIVALLGGGIAGLVLARLLLG